MTLTIISLGVLAVSAGLSAVSAKRYTKACRLYDSVKAGQEDYAALEKEIKAQRAELIKNRDNVTPLYSVPEGFATHLHDGTVQVIALYPGSRYMPVVKEWRYETPDDYGFALREAEELIEKLEE